MLIIMTSGYHTFIVVSSTYLLYSVNLHKDFNIYLNFVITMFTEK